jgi:putative ABC transport system permease protein
MRPDDRDFDEELRGHLALSVKERVERGEEPEAARRAALRELGYAPAIRDAMHRVWYSRGFDFAVALGRDMRVGARSLRRAKGLTATVVVTLALGIGANAAIFGVVREVLLRPLANRDEERLIYIRQSAPGIRAENTTFSMPEIRDLQASAKTISAFGDFSTIAFSMRDLGEPRTVRAGVVNGTYFEVMGLRPVLGRLLGPEDDRPDAACAVVLTHRFWSTSLNRDPSVLGKTIRLDARSATVVGVLEPSVPYPADTELIANVVTSPHHLGATMVTLRTHRMTELFGRLAPGATLEAARAELTAAHAAMRKQHPEAYPSSAQIGLGVKRLRDQIAAPARTVLILLLATAGVVFVIACSNVANLLLARSLRREAELAVRAALGASAGALRRTLLAESLVLCGAGAVLGVLLAHPFVAAVGRYAARFSVRALDASVDASLVWVGVALAMAAAVALAYVPRLPSSPSNESPTGLGLASGGVRITAGSKGRLRAFAATQIAFSFVLLAGAAMLLNSLTALQRAETNFELRQVLAVDVPTPGGFGPGVDKEMDFFRRVTDRIEELPGVTRVAVGSVVPWRDAGRFGPGFQFMVEGYQAATGEENPFAKFRNVSPGFFAALDVPLLSGRDFTDEDGRGEPVVMVSQSIAQRLFPNGDAVNRLFWWTDPVLGSEKRRIVGVVADLDDENVVPGPALTVYNPYRQVPYGGRLFVHTAGDPYALVAPVKRIVRDIAPEQPVERAATLEDVRAEVLAPERLNAFVFSGFAGVALLIAVVGVAGVLAFSVSARTREFGVRLAVGSTPRRLLLHVLGEGASLVAIGTAVGMVGGYALGFAAESYVDELKLPGVLPVLGAAALLGGAALAASLLPAARAARVDVSRALRQD